MSDELETQEIAIGNETWKVYKRGEHVCIVDAQDRERHRSRGHTMTAVHLAMQLARQKFESNEIADSALRFYAKKFIEGRH